MATGIQSRNINVFFLVQDLERPSTRVRILNLLPELKKHDITATVACCPRGLLPRFRLFSQARDYDLVYLQKKLFSPIEYSILRRFSRRLVFDFDDAIFLRDSSDSTAVCAENWRSLGRMLKFKVTTKHSDLVVAGNGYLAEKAAQFNSNVLHLPSAIPLGKQHPTHRDFPANSAPVIGWVGSTSTLKYLDLVRPVLRDLAGKRPFIFRIICDTLYDIEGVTCENVLWDLNTQDAAIANFDIGIMPLYDTPWSRGKCSYKLLQYMAAGVPFVASAVGMNTEVCAGNTTGYTADSEREFGQHLEYLLDNAEQRFRMGECGRVLVENMYSVTAVARRLAEKLRDLCER